MAQGCAALHILDRLLLRMFCYTTAVFRTVGPLVFAPVSGREPLDNRAVGQCDQRWTMRRGGVLEQGDISWLFNDWPVDHRYANELEQSPVGGSGQGLCASSQASCLSLSASGVMRSVKQTRTCGSVVQIRYRSFTSCSNDQTHRSMTGG